MYISGMCSISTGSNSMESDNRGEFENEIIHCIVVHDSHIIIINFILQLCMFFLSSTAKAVATARYCLMFNMNILHVLSTL